MLLASFNQAANKNRKVVTNLLQLADLFPGPFTLQAANRVSGGTRLC
jgi:hypothetical protein